MSTATSAPPTTHSWELLSNSPIASSRTDDLWFFDSMTGWLVNSSGYVCKTEDGGNSWIPKFFLYPNLPSLPYLRCMSWATRKIGWFGSVTGIDPDALTAPSQYLQTLLHQTTDGGETWHPITNLPEGSPAGICGFHAVNERVAYGSGTNDPGLPGPAIIKTTDNGASWQLIDMRPYASNLIDIYFFDEDNGFVVGGKDDGGCVVDTKAYPPPRLSRYGKVRPVVLRTSDGGKSWTNTAAGVPNLECGEWGWKIQFIDATHGFVSLENFRNASILVTSDGGQSWAKKHVAKDQDPSSPPLNNDLEGIGFLDERQGWVGGWGFPLADGDPFGGYQNTYTADGGETWVAQDNPPDPRFRVNRYRFVKGLDGTVSDAFCSGQQVYKMTGRKKGAFAARTHGLTAPNRRLEPANSTQSPTRTARAMGGAAAAPTNGAAAPAQGATTLSRAATVPDHGIAVAQVRAEDATVAIRYTLPEDAQNVFLGLWNKFAFHIRTLVDEKVQSRGTRTVVWDGKDDRGNPAGEGLYICRMCTAGAKGASVMVHLPGIA